MQYQKVWFFSAISLLRRNTKFWECVSIKYLLLESSINESTNLSAKSPWAAGCKCVSGSSTTIKVGSTSFIYDLTIKGKTWWMPCPVCRILILDNPFSSTISYLISLESIF